MKTIQMTFDEELLETVDQLVDQLHTTRSAFARVALKEAVKKFQTAQLEKKHRQGYKARPAEDKEFSVWEGEQTWGQA